MAIPSESIKEMISRLGIKQLNEMQNAAIQAGSKDQDLVLLSDTGSGKTVAYLLPLLAGMDKEKTGTQALIIAPSRELALQIEKVFKTMSTGFSVTCCYGGHLRETEENNLVERPSLIIGTPGRLADHIRRQNIHPATIMTLVLDEFDKSLELGFLDEMAFVIGSLPSLTKRILTSATTATSVPDFVGLQQPEVLNFLSGEQPERLELRVVHSPEKDKLETLFQLICWIGARSAVIFCNHRESVDRTSEFLKDKGLVNVAYHGAMEQSERDSALAKFRNGTSDILVTTDLAARGLDVPHIRYIIHYHLPNTEETFIHRNGRTARMEASGTAILLLGPEETLPSYITETPAVIEPDSSTELPDKPKWTTFFIAAGKKDKVNKVDIVGFLTGKGQLKKEDIGLIETKDFHSFVAIRKSKASHTLQLIKTERIKGKKIKIEIAK